MYVVVLQSYIYLFVVEYLHRYFTNFQCPVKASQYTKLKLMNLRNTRGDSLLNQGHDLRTQLQIFFHAKFMFA